MSTLLCLIIIAAHALVALAAVADNNDNSGGANSGPSAARLLASKRILNLYVVADLDMVIQYEVYNVGDATAYNVKLEDENFPSEYFKTVAGSTHAFWSRIAPHSNATHSVVLRPIEPVQFNFTSALIEYTAGDGNSAKKAFVQSSVPLVSSYDGSIYTWDKTMFVRRFSPHHIDWLVFAIMTIPSLAIPYAMFAKSRAKYVNNNNNSSNVNVSSSNRETVVKVRRE